MAIDTDPTGNTGFALGTTDGCISVAVSDTFNIDVIVNSIDPTNPLAGYGFDILYDPAIVQLGVDNDADNAARTSDTTDNDGDTIVDEPGEGYDEDSDATLLVDDDSDGSNDEDGASHTHVKLPTAAEFRPFPQGNNPAEPGGGGLLPGLRRRLQRLLVRGRRHRAHPRHRRGQRGHHARPGRPLRQRRLGRRRHPGYFGDPQGSEVAVYVAVNNVIDAAIAVGGPCDADGDGFGDGSDNCPAWPNAGQALPPWPVP